MHPGMDGTWAGLARSGAEDLRVRYVDLGSGWVIPVEVEIRGRFGADWGPETVRLTDPRRW